MEGRRWEEAEVSTLFDQPFMDLLFQAQTILRQNFPVNTIQISKLLNIKTGACPEDCAYCPQSAHYETGLEKEKLFPLETVIELAKKAKAQGATRFCLGAAWRSPPKKDLPKVLAMIKAINALGMESCVTLGLLDEEQAQELKAAGLVFYNHNLDTSLEFYSHIITTRTYADRLRTLAHVKNAGIKICCGGILGMGESRHDRIHLLLTIANLPGPPIESVPINNLIAIPGTPLANAARLDNFEFVRTIAVARIMMPKTWIRLSAGRESMNDETQALCFFAGANSIFYDKKLLTAANPSVDQDENLFARLGLSALV